VVDTSRSFVEWWATFDCDAEERDRIVGQLENAGFATWLGGLRRHLETGNAN
jgi:hypothetical protein